MTSSGRDGMTRSPTRTTRGISRTMLPHSRPGLMMPRPRLISAAVTGLKSKVPSLAPFKSSEKFACHAETSTATLSDRKRR